MGKEARHGSHGLVRILGAAAAQDGRSGHPHRRRGAPSGWTTPTTAAIELARDADANALWLAGCCHLVCPTAFRSCVNDSRQLRNATDYNKLNARARATAWVRLWTPSLPKILLRCFLIVPTETISASAIC